MRSAVALVVVCAAGLLATANSAAQMTAQPWQLTTQQGVIGGSSGVIEISKCNNASGVGSGASCSGYSDIGTSTKLAAGLAGAGTESFGSADLETGKVKIGATGPTYSDASAGASLRDSIHLSIPGLDAGEVEKIGIRFAIDGFFADGAQLSGTLSAISAFDQLTGSPLWRGTVLGGNNEPVSSTTYALADAPDFRWASATGDWTLSGPSIFEGEIDVWGDDPFVTLSLWLNGNNNFNLLSTATIDLILPTGATFNSDSGVFLSAIPEPDAFWLLAAGLGALVLWRRSRGPGHAGCSR